MRCRRAPRPLHLALTLGIVLTIASPPRPVAAKTRFRSYRVQPGDSCWSIALHFWGHGEKYALIHRYNRLGPLPHLLKPGQILRLPLSTQTPDAHIDWLRRDVRARAPYALDWRHAKPAMSLWRLYKVATGSASAAGIVFEDTSNLRMREHALLVIYGATSARSHLRRKIKTQIKVEEGTVVGGLARLDAAHPLHIQTPAALVALRSRRTQVEVTQRKTSLVSVRDGDAAVSAKGRKVSVPSGYGTRVLRGKRPAKPRPLPPRPVWLTESGGLRPLAPGTRGHLEARWHPTPRAHRYRLEVARDRAFHFPVAVAVVGAGVTHFRARDLTPGDYYARVSAIDRWGLEGSPSPLRHWRLVSLATSRHLTPRGDGSFEATGFLSLTLPGVTAYEVSLDGGPFHPADALRLSTPGRHRLRYRARGMRHFTELRVHLLRIIATLDLPKHPLTRGDRSTLVVHLKDERGHAASLPGLELLVAGHAQKLTALRAGTYQSTLVIPRRAGQERDHRLAIMLRWPFGTLAQATLRLKHARPNTPTRKPPSPFPSRPPLPRAGAPLLEWGGPAGLGLPSRYATPRTYLRFASHLGARQEVGSTNTIPLRVALGAGIALAHDRLGLDLDLPWYQRDLTHDEVGKNDLGDLRLGARVVAWRAHGLTFTPSLRITLPTADPSRMWRASTFEPALILAWRGLNDRLALNTNLILPLQTNFDDLRLTITQTFGAAYRVWRGLILGLEVAWLASLHDPVGAASLVPVLLGGQLGYGASRYRVSLTAGAGLDADARQRFGYFSAGLSVELFFPSL